jgi:hypothetical protein
MQSPIAGILFSVGPAVLMPHILSYSLVAAAALLLVVGLVLLIKPQITSVMSLQMLSGYITLHQAALIASKKLIGLPLLQINHRGAPCVIFRIVYLSGK